MFLLFSCSFSFLNCDLCLQAISTANTTTCFDCLSMVDSRQSQTISSWVTMLTGVNSL